MAATAPVAFPEQSEILAQYRAFFAALTPASKAESDARVEMMTKVATDPELSRVLGGMAASTAAGEVAYGEIVVRPEIMKVEDGTATVRDCQDTSEVGRVKVATGKKVTVGVEETLATVTMERGADGVWRVATIDNRPAGSCSAAA